MFTQRYKSYALISHFNTGDTSGTTVHPKIGPTFSVASTDGVASTNGTPYGAGYALQHTGSGGFTLTSALPSGIWAGDFVIQFWYRHNGTQGVYAWGTSHRKMFATGATSELHSIHYNVSSYQIVAFGVSLIPSTGYGNSRWIHHVVAKSGTSIIGGFDGKLGTVKTVGALSGQYMAAGATTTRDNASGYISDLNIQSGSGVANSWLNNSSGTYTLPTSYT